MKNDISCRKIFHITWPVMVSHGVIILVGIIDLLFVAPFGTLAITAVSLANFVCTGIYNFLEGLRSGTTVLVANYLGSNEKNKITKTLNQSLFFAFCISIPIVIIAYFISNLTYTVAGNWMHNPQVKNIGVAYLHIRLSAIPFVLTYLVIAGFFRGLKNTFVPFLSTIIICSLNAIFNYIFIYGKFDFPKMGIKGAAFATFLAYTINAIIIFIFLFKNNTSKPYVNFKNFFSSFKGTSIKENIKISSEIGGLNGILVFVYGIFAYIAATLGTQSFAVFQISLQIFLAVYTPMTGFLVATSIFVGKIIGSKEKKLLIPIVFKTWLVSFLLVAPICILMFSLSHKISHLFSPTDIVVAKNVAITLKLVALTLLVAPLYLVLRGALTGAKDTKFILIAGTITGYLIFLPLMYYCTKILNYGLVGGYTVFLFWQILDSTIYAYRFFMIKNKN